VIAGFMKSGTTFLFDSLAKHPQVIKNLRGVGFKESGCYMPDMMGLKSAAQRMDCYPFVEEGEVSSINLYRS
jgi:hypothetical protein